MMHPHCVYVFDSLTANEAAKAVEDGHFNNIIQYHNNKHQHSANKPMQGVPLGPPPPPQSMQAPPPHTHMMGGHPSYGPPPPPPPTHHHVSPPNHMQPQQQHPMGPGLPLPPPGGPHQPMQPQQQQPYDPSISPQKLKEREVKLNRISIIAERTQPAPSTMHQMTPANQRLAQGPSQAPQTQPQQQPPPPPLSQQQQQQQNTQQQHQAVKQEHQLDPLSSMQAMSECPNMEPNNYQHTIHHHPPS